MYVLMFFANLQKNIWGFFFFLIISNWPKSNFKVDILNGFFLKPKKKKKEYFPVQPYPPSSNYDPFNFHHGRLTDFYGEYHFQTGGRKVYSYCFDVRFEPRYSCRPKPTWIQYQRTVPDHNYDFHTHQHSHYHQYGNFQNIDTGQYIGEDSKV